jgi:hypothetical protein
MHGRIIAFMIDEMGRELADASPSDSPDGAVVGGIAARDDSSSTGQAPVQVCRRERLPSCCRGGRSSIVLAVLRRAEDCCWQPSEQWATRGTTNRSMVASFLGWDCPISDPLADPRAWCRGRSGSCRSTGCACAGHRFGRRRLPIECLDRAGHPASLLGVFHGVGQPRLTCLFETIRLDCFYEGVLDVI